MIKFYKVDQALPENRAGRGRFIGIEGEEIKLLTNGELYGGIFEYSYIKGMGEFYLLHENYPEFGKFQGRWSVVLREPGLSDRYDRMRAIVRHNGKTVAEYEWRNTKQQHTRGGVREEYFGKQEGMKLTKKENHYNFLRIIIKTWVALKKEGKY